MAGMKACVIFNPAARGARARRVLNEVRALGGEAVLRPTHAAGMGRVLAAAAVQEGFETIVAVGGDGTINEVVNGLADVPGGLAGCRLGVLPSGTANVFARELGLSGNVRAAWAAIREGRERVVDVVEMEFVRAGQAERRVFVQLAGAGLDARATEVVSWELKKRVGYLAYVVACLRALRERHPRIEVAGVEGGVEGELVLMGNGERYGGSFRVFPGASLADGLVDVCVFPRVGYGTVWASAWAALTDGWGRMRGVRRFRSGSFALRAASRVPLELDGEPVGVLPATCRVLPSVLRVVGGGGGRRGTGGSQR